MFNVPFLGFKKYRFRQSDFNVDVKEISPSCSSLIYGSEDEELCSEKSNLIESIENK